MNEWKDFDNAYDDGVVYGRAEQASEDAARIAALEAKVAELKGAVRTARSYFCDPYSTFKDPAAAGFKEMADRLLSEENK